MRGVAAVVVVVALILALVPAEPAQGQFAVFDVANLAAKITDYLERLFEIVQRATQLVHEVEMLEYWFRSALKLESIPFQFNQLEFLNGLSDIVREFDALKDQYQALSFALDELSLDEEFDFTFPGWRAPSALTDDDELEISTEGGDYTFSDPLSYERYRLGRVHQSVRQSLRVMAQHQGAIGLAQEKAASLKLAAIDSEGAEQTRQVQLGLATLSTEQLIGLRSAQQSANWAIQQTLARQVDREMQGQAAQSQASRTLANELESEFGQIIPEPAGGVSPFPSWVIR